MTDSDEALLKRWEKFAANLVESSPFDASFTEDVRALIALARASGDDRDLTCDLIRAAYIQGATDVHNNWREDRDPEFGEAASDYVAARTPASPTSDDVERVKAAIARPGKYLDFEGNRAEWIAKAAWLAAQPHKTNEVKS